MTISAMVRQARLLVAIGCAILVPAMPGRAVAASAPSEGTLVTFTARAEQRLVRDRLVAELAVEATNADPVRLQGEINRRMTAALARAKAVAGVTATTGGYSVFSERPKNGPARWNGRQNLRLEAGDQAALLRLVGELQGDGLVLASLDATVAPAAAQAVEDRLTDEALRRVKERAGKIAAALGLRVVRIRSLRVGNVAPPQPMIRAMALSMAAQPVPPPALAPGEATVDVSVEAEIELGAAP